MAKVIHRHEGPFVQAYEREFWLGPCRWMEFCPEEDDNIDMHLGMCTTANDLNPDRINVHLDLEMPNMWLSPKSRIIVEERERGFDKIFSNNPKIVETRNKFLGEDKWEYSWFPVNETNIPKDFTKKYDIFFTCLWGDNPLMTKILRPILDKYKENSCVVATDNRYDKQPNDPDHWEKLQLNAHSKITLGYNYQPIFGKYVSMAEELKSLGIIEYSIDPTFRYRHFSHHKSRNIDGFLSKSVVMIFKDAENIIEDFWEEGKHFIYYETYDDLDEKVKYVLDHYSEFDNMRNDAFEFTKNNYTTQAFYNKFLRGKF